MKFGLEVVIIPMLALISQAYPVFHDKTSTSSIQSESSTPPALKMVESLPLLLPIARTSSSASSSSSSSTQRFKTDASENAESLRMVSRLSLLLPHAGNDTPSVAMSAEDEADQTESATDFVADEDTLYITGSHVQQTVLRDLDER